MSTGRVKPSVGFVLEATLGHGTHAANLQKFIPRDARIDARFGLVDFPASGPSRWLPAWNNWTIQAGRQARQALRQMGGAGALDAIFIHTQVPAVLNTQSTRSIPSIVSLDVTPVQYDEVGRPYGHRRGNRVAERLKLAANRRCLQSATRIVAWSELARVGLLEAYGVDPDRITVISPGVDLERFTSPERPAGRGGPLRVLFVGGDFERKGGDTLVDAIGRLRGDGANIEVDIVTRDAVRSGPGVHVHHGLTANSPALVSLFHRADVFCLPTLADTFGIALIEAGATGLPLVATDVGPIGEVVRDGVTGLLVRPGDSAGLATALRTFVDDPNLAPRLGTAASRLVADKHDASANAVEIVDVVLEMLESPR